MKTNKGGFTLVEVMIVVAIVGLLATMAMPSYVRARENSQESVCLNNLRLIHTAKTQFVWEGKLLNGDVVDPASLNPYLKSPFATYREPAGKSYEVRPVGEDPICTFGGSHRL